MMVKRTDDDGRSMSIWISTEVIDYVEKIAQHRKWSFSQTVREIILAAQEAKLDV